MSDGTAAYRTNVVIVTGSVGAALIRRTAATGRRAAGETILFISLHIFTLCHIRLPSTASNPELDGAKIRSTAGNRIRKRSKYRF